MHSHVAHLGREGQLTYVMRKYVPTTTITDDNNRRGETFSFSAMLDITDAHTGEEPLNGVALDAPMRLML